MDAYPDVPIGERLARLRRRHGLSQERLAERSGVSVDVIRKLEQGRRRSALMATLTALARALDVEVSVLVGQPSTVRSDDSTSLVLAIREALTSLDDFPGLPSDVPEGELPSLDDLRRALSHAERVRLHGSFTELGRLLPGLIAETRAVARGSSGDDQVEAFGLLSEAFQIAATMMTALGKEDLGYIGLMRAQEAARASGNKLLEAMNSSWLSWVLLKQGRLDDAARAAVVAADRIEPDLVRDQSSRVAVWGVLMLRAASASVRGQKADRADEFLSLARMAASRVGADQSIYATPFGPTNAVVASVNAAVELGEYRNALSLARDLPAEGWVSPTWKARYKIDLAIAQAATRKIPAAVDSLLQAEAIAPDWMRHHALARDVVREVAERSKRRHSPVQELAGRLHVEV
ncbi:helix-turn-helix domain-containing protein [Actinomadura roseirufa]|uniref:helix-turn-helix domain-containing protein n=1 Tax=Actinomadura roseirufa TaxID=2094049 RepID=UPI0013F15D7A|nr:helix-turn-helix domain-containing protein [Actinomadura roseirufa]